MLHFTVATDTTWQQATPPDDMMALVEQAFADLPRTRSTPPGLGPEDLPGEVASATRSIRQHAALLPLGFREARP